MTFAELANSVLTLAYPSRMARNLIDLRTRHVLSGLIELQTAILSLQKKNTDIFPEVEADIAGGIPGTYQCGAMVVQAPAGNVLRVEAFRSDLPSDTQQTCECLVDYTVRDVSTVKSYADDWVRNGGRRTDSKGNVLHMLPVPRGTFSIDLGELWAYPAVSEPWRLRVVWTGIKQVYAPLDQIVLTEAQFDLLRILVLSRGAIDEKCWQDATNLRAQYQLELRRELLREWEQNHPARHRRPTPNPPPVPWVSLPSNCCTVPPPEVQPI